MYTDRYRQTLTYTQEVAATSALFSSPRCKYSIDKYIIEILSLKFIITLDVLFKVVFIADIYHSYIEKKPRGKGKYVVKG